MSFKETLSNLGFAIDKKIAGVISNHNSKKSYAGKLMQEKTLLEREIKFANSTNDKILLNKISQRIDDHNCSVMFYANHNANTENQAIALFMRLYLLNL